MPVLQDDIEAWCESPVTREFVRIIKARQTEVYDERLFFEGDPNRTQEAMAWRNGAGDMLQEIIDMHDEKTIYFNGEEQHEQRLGIYPKGNRVLVKPDVLAETAGESSLIHVPEEIRKQHQQAQVAGVFVDAGDEAWLDYRQPFAQPGERVMFAQWAGVTAVGADGEEYRVMNDVDITATIDDTVFFDQLRSRERLTGAM